MTSRVGRSTRSQTVARIAEGTHSQQTI